MPPLLISRLPDLGLAFPDPPLGFHRVERRRNDYMSLQL
jgi:hypothetical protein